MKRLPDGIKFVVFMLSLTALLFLAIWIPASYYTVTHYVVHTSLITQDKLWELCQSSKYYLVGETTGMDYCSRCELNCSAGIDLEFHVSRISHFNPNPRGAFESYLESMEITDYKID